MNKKYLTLSISLLSVFTLLTLIVFYNVKYSTNFSSSLIDTDKFILQFFNTPNSPSIYQFMKYLSDYGRDYFWPLITLIFLVWGVKYYKVDNRGLLIAFILVVSFIIIIPINIITKDLVDRQRPQIPVSISSESGYTVVKEDDRSFPSAHASLVSAGALTVALFFRNSWKSKLISLLLIIEAGLVSISRLYLGVHYPSDVISGILLGSGVSLFISSFESSYERLFERIKTGKKKRNTVKK